MTRLDSLIQWIQDAGTLGEENTDRDGFASHSGETHSLAYGSALGFGTAAALAGYPLLLGLILASLGGVTGKRRFGNERVWREVQDEPQYFAASIVAGGLAGVVALAALGAL